jgi:hypothetical protein
MRMSAVYERIRNMSNTRTINGISTIRIGSNDYITVAERLRLMHEAKKELEIVESGPHQAGDRWVWRVVCLIEANAIVAAPKCT